MIYLKYFEKNEVDIFNEEDWDYEDVDDNGKNVYWVVKRRTDDINYFTIKVKGHNGMEYKVLYQNRGKYFDSEFEFSNVYKIPSQNAYPVDDVGDIPKGNIMVSYIESINFIQYKKLFDICHELGINIDDVNIL